MHQVTTMSSLTDVASEPRPDPAANGTLAPTPRPTDGAVLDVTKRDTGAVVTELPRTSSSRGFKTTIESMAFNVNDFNSGLKCGRRPMHQKTRNRIKRIVGGSSATEGEWPWQVSDSLH